MQAKFLFLAIILFASCNYNSNTQTEQQKLNTLAEKYVRLGLTIGQYDSSFVDAYYGPDSLKPKTAKSETFPKDSLLASVDILKAELGTLADHVTNDTTRIRANWIVQQLTAFGRRIRIFSGELKPFDEESIELFGVTAPVYPEAHFKSLISSLDSLLPGRGPVPDRFQRLANKFIIPKDKLDTVFKTAIAEARKRTLEHYQLPAHENFSLEYVTGKSWSGYNWYKGNYNSLIQISEDLNIFIEKAIDLACHEGYPGHHVYNMLLEKNLYRDRGWVEISLYPLFSPQSLIAEGSANYGIELAFPGTEKNEYTRSILLPLAGLDTTGLNLYFKALAIKGELNYSRNEVARGLLSKSMTEEEALRWLMDYTLLNKESAIKSISFIRNNRSYVINYNYGLDLVKKYIGDSSRWEKFGALLSNPVTTADLTK